MFEQHTFLGPLSVSIVQYGLALEPATVILLGDELGLPSFPWEMPDLRAVPGEDGMW